MKKAVRGLISVLGFMLIGVAAGCVGPGGYYDHGAPDNLPLIGEAGGGQAGAEIGSAANRILAEQTAAFRELSRSINNLVEQRRNAHFEDYRPDQEKKEQTMIGKPTMGEFGQYAGKKTGDQGFDSRPKEKRRKDEEGDKQGDYGIIRRHYGEIGELKDRVSRLEEVNDALHPETDAEIINFDEARTCLTPEAKTWLNEKARLWFEGKIDILAINGYASITKPRDPEITNIAYARERLEAAAGYLQSLGIPLGGVERKVKGPTKRFNNNTVVTLTLTHIPTENPEEIEKRKIERARHKKN